jgi:hypothetical protein
MKRVVFALIAMCAGCSTSAPDDRFTATVPDRASFPPVAQLLVHRCGTLDCHGSAFRNLRVYGNEGLRWASGDRPLSPPCTTATEVDQDFLSLDALEPEILSAVVLEHGAQPERLTFLLKARGSENHKGGSAWAAGSPEDMCVTGWLAGQETLPNDGGPLNELCMSTAPATLLQNVTCATGP